MRYAPARVVAGGKGEFPLALIVQPLRGWGTRAGAVSTGFTRGYCWVTPSGVGQMMVEFFDVAKGIASPEGYPNNSLGWNHGNGVDTIF